MPRRIFSIFSKQEPHKKITLNSLSYDTALEEAINLLDSERFKEHQESIDEHALSLYCVSLEQELEKLGWVMSESCDEPYNSMFIDEHMMSLWNQRSEYGEELKAQQKI